jgi:FtsH-binding integral membrane protein
MANSSIYNALFSKYPKKKRGGALDSLADFSTLGNKSQFLILVFSNLLLQLTITYYTMENTPNAEKYNWIILAISSLVILLILILVPMPAPFKFVLFAGFSYITGLLLARIKNKSNEDDIKLAIKSTISVFVAMFLTGLGLFMGGIYLGVYFGIGLFVLLLGLIIVELLSQFDTISVSRKYLAIFGILIFSAYVLYDTNVILQRDYAGDFITASIDYYLDIVNLFTDILSLEQMQ